MPQFERPRFPGRTVALPLLATGVINFGGEWRGRTAVIAVGVLAISWNNLTVVTADGQIWMVPKTAVDLDEGQILH